MKIQKCHFSNGSIAAVLVYPDTNCPVFLPLTYYVLFLVGKSYSTSYKTSTAIKELYEFFSGQYISFEEQAISGEFQQIIDKLDSFISFLYSGSKKDGPVSNQQFDFFLRSIKDFLKWLISRYNRETSSGLHSLIEQKFSSRLVHHKSFHSEIKSLDDETLQLIRSLILPTSTTNPFRSGNRLRNWLMIEILVNTGMRAGELLNLKVPDVYKNGENHYVKIRESTEQEIDTDTRWNKPSIKNGYSVRVVAISKLIYLGYEKYLAAERRKKTKKIKHGYLFTSERGHPLAQNSLSFSLNQILDKLKQQHHVDIDLTPHVLRHTFVERMLKYLLEVKQIDMERAKDELRNICGWSATSPMPNLYARRYIAMLANAHNVERINYSYSN